MTVREAEERIKKINKILDEIALENWDIEIEDLTTSTLLEYRNLLKELIPNARL